MRVHGNMQKNASSYIENGFSLGVEFQPEGIFLSIVGG
jgi:hypothetical protein